MLDPDMSYGEEVAERVPSLMAQDSQSESASVDVRRRIERIRELKKLRELLDDPDFDELG